MQLEPERMVSHNNEHYDSNNERHGFKQYQGSKKFLKSSKKVEFKRRDRQEAYMWMEQTLEKFGHCHLSKTKG